MVTRVTKGILKEYIYGPSIDIIMINSFLSTLKRDMGPMSKMKNIMKSQDIQHEVWVDYIQDN
jgi:hypothetical protein